MGREGSEEEGRRGKKKGRRDGWEEGREGDFQMFEILTASVLCSANMRHHSKFCADRSNRYMAVFQFFKMAAVRHLGFLKVENFNCPYLWGPKCITVPNYVQIGRTVAEIWPFFDISRWRPTAILDLSKLADIEGAQLGSLEKLVSDGHI